jgi:hypothetical protein
MGFRWARQTGMVAGASRRSKIYLDSSQASPNALEKIWKRWVAEEIQLRAILGHYVLDGLLTDFSGQPTAVRHTANPVLLPSCETVFEARTADEWLAEMRKEEECNLSFKDVYVILFEPQSELERLPSTSLSVRVILEALQSMIYEHHEAGGQAIGTPSKTDIGRALVRFYYSHIQHLPSLLERVEHAIRWHVICIQLAIENASLAKQICDLYGFPQDLQNCKTQTVGLKDFSEWVDKPNARRAILHAVALADACQELNLGRAHMVHLPTAVYTAATIYTSVIVSACQRRRKSIITVPRVHSWHEVWSGGGTVDGPSNLFSEDCNGVAAFLSGANINAAGGAVRRSLTDELHGLFLIMQQLQPYWGVTREMSKVIKQWITIPNLTLRHQAAAQLDLATAQL